MAAIVQINNLVPCHTSFKKKSGRSFVQILEMVQNLRQIVKEHPSTSIKRLRQQVKLSYGNCRKILRIFICLPIKFVLQETKSEIIIINEFFCSTLSEFENFLLCERILINVTICQNETSS
jgi:hypothetical protein